MKLIYLVIDGAPDRVVDSPTALEVAKKENLDRLAKEGVCGCMYTIGRGIAPESDTAVFSILGYDPEKYYTGRGPIEALGAGIEIREGFEVAFRANFATIREDILEILDRRCGRDLASDEARELARALDGLELGMYDGYARVIATVGHRAVVVIGSRSHRLSDNVSNTDPAYVRCGKISVAAKTYEKRIAECKPLDDSREARVTAELVNRFTRLAITILSKHPVNVRRERLGKLKANAILLRDAGAALPKVPKLSEVYGGLKFGAVAEMPVEKGIAKLLGMEVAEVPPPTEDKVRDYAQRLEATLELLERCDVVYVHLKGPDEPGHDGSLERKARAIELIDQYYVKPLIGHVNLDEVAILVTSDHATPYTVKAHTDDPVPILVRAPSIEPDQVTRFTEKECCQKGSLGVLEHGWELLPRVLSLVGMLRK
ncbi:MAG: phosphonopyruvate decarboxylase [Thermoprotei archaeon]|nr:MAG: phosphonopyruvate decarboxylase [Thermoprotei archaeon]